MRNPTIAFARPRQAGMPGEPIELSDCIDVRSDCEGLLQWPDPRKGPAKQMSPEGFLEWLCCRHTNLERNILIGDWLRHLRKAVGGRVTLFLKTAEPPALRIEMRVGRIAPTDLKLLRRHANARTLHVQLVEEARLGLRGAACFVGGELGCGELVGVFSARDGIVLER